MLHRVVRPLLRVALLSVLLGAVPPAPVLVAHALPQQIPAVVGPPVANASATAASAPLAAPTSTTVPHPEPPPESIPPHAPITAAHPHALGNLPLSFVQNAGQVDSRVRYMTRGLGGTLFFTSQELVLTVPTGLRPRRTHEHSPRTGVEITNTQAISMSIVRQRYEGAGATPTIVPGDPLPGTANYFLGSDTTKWRTNLATYSGIVYQQLYPGIDLSYDGTNGQIKSTYAVAAGADPSRIHWHYQGVQDVQVDGATGNLLIILAPPRRISATQTYTLTEQAPVAWQTINGLRVSIPVQFVVGAGGRVGFSLGAYDTRQPLTIDPTLTYSTYLGGVYGDDEYGLAVDSSGNMYVTGASYSTNFPTTAGALDTTYDPNGDMYVAKLTADGSGWAYSTFVGGSNYEVGSAIAVDIDGNAFVTGATQSTNFPTTVGAADRTCGSDGLCNPHLGNSRDDTFVIKLNATGNALTYSTYLGGNYIDDGFGIALDSAGNAYVTGTTSSTDFPTTLGAYDTTCGTDGTCDIDSNGYWWDDTFVTKVNTDGTALSYSTFVGGSDWDWGYAIALDSANNAYITGMTWSANYPISSGAPQTVHSAGGDVFVTKLNTTGTALTYSTFLGGISTDWGRGIAIDSNNNAYVTGYTQSTDFPTTVGAYDRTCGTDNTCNYDSNTLTLYKDAFVTKVNSAGTAWAYSTYLGGSDFETGRAIAVDSSGNAYITGQTQSTNYPVTLDAWQPTNYGHYDVIVSELNASGSALNYSTYLGGSSEPWFNSEQTEDGRSIAVDSSGTIYVAGITNSTDFPRASGAPQQTYGGGSYDAFIAKFGTGTPLDPKQSRGPEECLDCAIHGIVANWFTSKPVNTRTGSYWTTFTDLAVQSPGPALVWSRTYASQATSDLTTTLGFGWQHPYGASAILPTMPGGQAGQVIILSAIGNQLRFTDQGGGSYRANSGIYSTLVHGSGVYTQTLRDQTQRVFSDTTGRLTAMRDTLGRTLTLTYNTATPPQLTDITDANDSSRSLHLTYTSGRITQVSDGTRSVVYTYDPTTGDLTKATDVRGQDTRFTYQSHLLTQIKDPLGQNVESMGYQGTGSASKVVTQTLQTGEQLAFSYLSATTVLTTTGLDGRREVRKIPYNSNNAMAGMYVNDQPIFGSGFDTSFSPATVSNGNGKTTTTSFSSNGLPLKRTDPLGQITRTIYDTQNHPISTTDALGVTTLFTYDKLGNLLTTTAGVTTTSSIRATTIYTYTYLNASNAWVALAQPLTAPLPKDSRLSDQRAPDGVVTHYDYDPTKAHQVTKMTVGYGTALKQETTYAYDALGRVTSTTVAANNASLARTDTTVYNADNTIAKTIQNYKGTGIFSAAAPDQNITTFYGYDKLGRTIAVTDTLGTVNVTRYNAKGQVEATARNIAKPWSRDSLGQPVIPAFIATTPNTNIATQYGYDGLGRTVLVTQTGILTGTFNTSTLQFSSATTRVTKTDYDLLSRPVTTTLNYRPGLPVLADTNIPLYTRYDGASNVITQTDALGRWFVTQYDALNRPVKTIANYQDGNPLTGPRDADIVTVTHYDAAGRVDRQTDNYVDGTFSATEPITDRVTLSLYDTLGRSTTTTLNYASGLTDPSLNRSTTTAYDEVTGRVTGQQDALLRWVSQQYDVLGRVTKTVQNCVGGSPPASCTGSVTVDQNVATQSAYDTLNRTTIVTDALTFAIRTVYDGLGRTLKTIRHYQDGAYSSSAPDTDVITSYRYDALGRTLAVTDTLGKATTSTVNALGQTVSTTDQLGRVTLMGYDGTGTLRWTKRLDGQITLSQVDGLGRTSTTIANYKDGVVAANEPADTDLTTRTVYDAAGRRLQTRVKTSATTERITQFAYDGLDRLIGVTENYQSSGCTIAPCNVATAYQYDRAGNRTKIIDPLSHARSFTYTAADEQKKAIDALGFTGVYTYDQLGRLTNQGSPRGASNNLTLTYDNVDRLKTTSATNLGTITNNYDALGRRTSLVDGTGTTSFTPDALGRITQVVSPNTGTILYSYDGRGLRTKLTYPTTGTVINYSYFDDGRLNLVTQGASSPVTQATYGYDPVGRLAQIATKDSTTPASQLITNYDYDGADRLRALRTSEAGTTLSGYQYQTDRLGLRSAITETLPLSPTIGTTRIKTITFESAQIVDAVTGVDSVTPSTAPTAALTTTVPLKGAYSVAVNTANTYLTQNFAGADDLYLSFYLRVDASQATTAPIAQIINSGTTVAVIQLTNSNKLRLLNNTTQIGSDSPTALTVGTIYRVGLHQRKSTSVYGVLEAYVVQGDTPFGMPFAAGIMQTFTTQATQLKLGAPSATKAAITLDDVTLDTSVLAPPSKIAGLQRNSASMSATDAKTSSELAGRTTMQFQAVAAPIGATPSPTVTAGLGALPLSFMPNAGQIDPVVRYHTHGLGGSVFFTPGEIVLALPFGGPPHGRHPHEPGATNPISATQPISVSVVRLNYLGANATSVLSATDRLPGSTNYFIGNDATKWHTNLPTYAGIVYQQLYPGIDLRYDGTDGHLKSTYTVAAGADPSRLRWRYIGARDVRVDSNGNLLVLIDPPGGVKPGATTVYTLTEAAPLAWQMINGQQVAVDVRYAVAQGGTVSFVLGTYDASQPLIIDPTLTYSTYLGGSDIEEGDGIAVDGLGNTYVTGRTFSTNFPTQNPKQGANAGNYDIFVTKLTAAGNTASYSTYLGGSDSEGGEAIAVDESGTVYLTGYTYSTNFPTANPKQGSLAGGGIGGTSDAFVVKLNAAGSSLTYSTYLGGSSSDFGFAITIDASGNAYITGNTYSSNFPTLNPKQAALAGTDDAFVTKLNAAGSAFGYSTYLGGSGSDDGEEIAVDTAGSAYVTGQTTSTNFATFPTSGAIQAVFGGSTDAFITKFNATGSAFSYSTYLGGSSDEIGSGIAIDKSGNAYVTGDTYSTNFPTVSPFQSTNAANDDAFVTKVNAAGSALVYSTYLGGNLYDFGVGIAVDYAGDAYVTGGTWSTNFPTVSPFYNAYNGGVGDVFVTKFNPAGSALLYSTYLGGSGDEAGRAIALDGAGNAYITGGTTSTDFATANPFQGTTTGGICGDDDACSDAFVVKVNPSARIKDITFEGGSLTDAPTGMDSVSGAATLDSGAMIKSLYSARIPNNTAYLEKNFVGTDDFYLAFYVRLKALPSTDARIAMVSNAGTTIGNILLRTNGKLGLRNGSTQVGSDSALALQPNTLYRIGLHQKKGTGTNAVLEAFVIQGDNLFGTPFASMSNGTWITRVDRVRLGATNGNAVDLWLDDIGLDSAAMPLPTVPQPVRIVRYNYDGLQRLIGAGESASTVYTYTYDLAGNRTAVQLNGGTSTTTTYNAANQITNAGFTYDNAGNLTNDGTAAYTYDALNRTTARGSTSYAYNGDGTLVSQTASSVTTRYTQDLAAPLTQILQTKVGSAVQTDYIYGLSRLASLNSGVKTWYAADALGSVRRTVTDAGLPLGVINYDPWGTVESGTVPTFGFTGEVQDSAAGLVNLRARWYSTARGRFMSVDSFAGVPESPYSLHQYAYALSDPVLLSDPSGRCSATGQGDDYCHEDPKCQPFDLRDPFNPHTCKVESEAPTSPPSQQYVPPTSTPGIIPEAMRRFWAGTPVNQLIADLWYFSSTTTAIDIRASRALGYNTLACQTTLVGIHAFLAWRDYVKKDAPLDVKGEYAIRFGKSMRMFDDNWTSQLSGNMLYGFVGLSVGFTKLELTQFAGVAQFEDHCRNKHEPNAVGPGAEGCQIRDLPNTWDKPTDQAEIEAGFELYDQYSSLFLTPYGHRLEEKRDKLKGVLMRYRGRIPKE